MARNKHFGFYNDGEFVMELTLTPDQQELLGTLMDYGFIVDGVQIQDHGEECLYPPYYNCPECGKQLILLAGEYGEAEYWCDDCGLDITVSVAELEEEE